MINYIVNGRKYKVKRVEIPIDQTCGSNFFFKSDQYFIKEAFKYNPTVCGNAVNSIQFYKNHYVPGLYQVPKLIDHQIQKLKIKLVFEYIGSKTLATTVLSRQISDEEGRSILEKILEAIIPLEQNNIHHGDIKLKNIIMKGDKAFLIDFDLLGHKQNYAKLIALMVYDFKHAPETQDFAHTLKMPLPTDIEEYHSCCQDVVEAILDGKVSTAKQMLDLIAQNDQSDATQQF